jgi:predicted MFS family arabinose efflux permease
MSGRAVAVLSLAAFANAGAQRVGDPLLPLLAQAFGTTAGGASAVLTAFAVAYGGLQLVNGPLGDRVGKYRLVCWATAISAACTLACALAPTLPLLVAARFASGATTGAIVPLAMAWIGDTIPYERRQAVLARFLIGTLLGGAIATAASGVLGERFGWQAVFQALAGLYVVAAALLWRELRVNPATRRHTRVEETMLQSAARMFGLLRRPWVRVVLVTVFLEGALSYGGFAFAAYHVHHALGLSVSASGLLAALAALGGLVYAAVAGRLVPRLGERGLVIGGGLLLFFGLPGLALSPNAVWAAAALVAQGLGLILLHNTLQVHATQMAPESRGAALALFAFSLFTGQSGGVWLASRFVDAHGTAPVFLAAGAGLVALAFWFQRRLAGRRRETASA